MRWRKSWRQGSFACEHTNQQTIPMTPETFHWTSLPTRASMVPTRDKVENDHEHQRSGPGGGPQGNEDDGA